MLQLFDFELRPYRSNESICWGRAQGRQHQDRTALRRVISACFPPEAYTCRVSNMVEMSVRTCLQNDSPALCVTH
jgi:hypothetical protein